MPACMEPRYGDTCLHEARYRERCHSYGKKTSNDEDKFAMSVLKNDAIPTPGFSLQNKGVMTC